MWWRAVANAVGTVWWRDRAVAPKWALGYIRELMRYGTLLFLLASGLTAQQASIEGVTVNASTEPLSGVHVRLITGTFGGVTGAYGAVSDRCGHFSMASLRPGTYVLAPDRAGYLYVQAKEANPSMPKDGPVVAGYVTSMRLGQTNFEGPLSDLSNGSGGAPRTLDVASSKGVVSGAVRHDKRPADGARIALVAEDIAHAGTLTSACRRRMAATRSMASRRACTRCSSSRIAR